MNTWHPIETAPKDRNIVIHSAVSGVSIVARWCGERFEDMDGVGLLLPTHWIPLPDPPVVITVTFSGAGTKIESGSVSTNSGIGGTRSAAHNDQIDPSSVSSKGK